MYLNNEYFIKKKIMIPLLLWKISTVNTVRDIEKNRNSISSNYPCIRFNSGACMFYLSV